MKKIAIIILCYLPLIAPAQWITQSAEGKGSFLFKGTNVNFDMGKTDLSVTFNNLNRPFRIQPTKRYLPFYSLSLSGKNEEGIGTLFSSSEFVPSAQVTGIFGIQISDSYTDEYTKASKDLNDHLQALNEQQVIAFRGEAAAAIDIELARFPETFATPIEAAWSAKLKESSPHQFVKYLNAYKTDSAELKAVIKSLVNDFKKKISEIEEQQQGTVEEIIAIRNAYLQQNLKQLSLFIYGGANGSTFKRMEAINTTNFAQSFIKEEFRGGRIGIGANYQLGRWKFGLTLSYRKTNNFDDLTKNDFKITSITTSGDKTMTQERTVVAYTGDYGEVGVNEFNGDIIYTASVDEKESVYTMLNAYVRGVSHSRNTEIIQNTYAIGLGSYFFGKKSKFLGGFYLELPDVANQLEKSKPEEDQDLKPAWKRLTLGVSAKFSLSSMISQQ